MKAPDKIYIHEASAPELAEPVLKEYHIEYIRKDALLEWAKNWQDELDDSLGASMVYHVLNAVINKIESL